jgi:DNA binding domain, excisionase family
MDHEKEDYIMTLCENERVLYTIKEVSVLLHINTGFVYQLVNAGLLPALKLGSLKVRKTAIEDFLAKYEGYDLSELDNIRLLNSAS